jgi:hypothetical protein
MVHLLRAIMFVYMAMIKRFNTRNVASRSNKEGKSGRASYECFPDCVRQLRFAGTPHSLILSLLSL